MPRKPPKPSRTFADAMRESAGGSDEGMVWSGGILERKAFSWAGSVAGKLDKLTKAKQRKKPKGGPELTLHIVRELLSENQSPGGCFGCASLLLGFILVGAVMNGCVDFFDSADSLYYGGWDYFVRFITVAALPLSWLLIFATAVPVAGWFRKRYEERLEKACAGLDPQRMMIPCEEDLAETYYYPSAGFRWVLFGRLPKDQEGWTNFLAANFDLYLERYELYRVGLTGWVARTPYVWFALLAAAGLYLPQLNTWLQGYAEIPPELAGSPGFDFDDSAIFYATLMVHYFVDSLRDTRKLVFANYMYRHLKANEHPEIAGDEDEE